jgi:uncharacterized membrane protein
MVLELLGFLAFAALFAGEMLPKPPGKSGWISFWLAVASLASGALAIACFRYETLPVLGVVGFFVAVVGSPLAAMYSLRSFPTTRHRWLAGAGFLISLVPVTVFVSLIVALRNLRLG